MKVEEKISGKVKEFTHRRDRVYRELVGMENEGLPDSRNVALPLFVGGDRYRPDNGSASLQGG